MSFWSAFGGVFKKIGSFLLDGIKAAAEHGLSDQVIGIALYLVKEAAVKFADSSERREWCVAQLVAKGIPESLARLGVELAYQLFQKELGKPTVSADGIIWGS